MGPVTVSCRIRIRLDWWVRPYARLTALGVWLGLPINPEVVAADLKRGIKISVEQQS